MYDEFEGDEMSEFEDFEFDGEDEFEDFEFRPRNGMPMRRRAPMAARPRPRMMRPGMQRRRPGLPLGRARLRGRPPLRRPGLRPRPPLQRPGLRPMSRRPAPARVVSVRPATPFVSAAPPAYVRYYGYPVHAFPYPFPYPYPPSNGRDHGADVGADLDPNVLVDMGADTGADFTPDTGADSSPDTGTDFTPDGGATHEPEPATDAGSDSSTDSTADASADFTPDAGADATEFEFYDPELEEESWDEVMESDFRPTPVEPRGGGRIQNKTAPRPSDVVTVSGYGGKRVPLHRLAADAWRALVSAARAAGLRAPLLLPVSGFRDPRHQQRLWNAALARYGSPQEARKWVAPPGGSAHQSGRAIDFYLGGSNSSRNVSRLRATPAYRWLVANASRFGFYPYSREPWHWEYNPPASA